MITAVLLSLSERGPVGGLVLIFLPALPIFRKFYQCQWYAVLFVAIDHDYVLLKNK